MRELVEHTEGINRLMARYGVKFGIYKGGEFHEQLSVVDNRNYAAMLRQTMDWVNIGGIPVIMTPGRYNAAYFEHSYLAERTGSELATCTDLFVEDNCLYYRDYREKKQKGRIML